MTILFWIAAALMTLVALAAAAWPLLKRGNGTDGEDPALEIYRRQLGEVDADLANGMIDDQQAESARTEISRRMLARDSERNANALSSGRRPVMAGVIALAVPLLAVGLYYKLGAPGLPDQPVVSRDADGGAGASTGVVREDMANLAKRLADRLEREPNDTIGWKLLGQTYATLDRHAAAAEAYKKAEALSPEDRDIPALQGEALVAAAGGMVTPAAEAAFKRAGNEPRSRYYLALAMAQQGDLSGARGGWSSLAADSPADAPWLEVVRRRISEIDAQLGSTSPAPPVPSADAVAAAQQMAPGDRDAMVRGMVANLAERLKSNPGDFDGWIRLARSYSVLGDRAKAADALVSARFAAGDRPERLQQLAEATAALDAPAGAPAEPQPTSPPPAPSADTVAAAQQMAPGDRDAMIRGMVANLAERLKSNPGDFDGWIRLARSYSVLGDRAKAVEALSGARAAAADRPDRLQQIAQATAMLGGSAPVAAAPPAPAVSSDLLASRADAAPGDLVAQRAYAEQMIAELDSDRLPLRLVTVLQRILSLAPADPDALWYLGLHASQTQNPIRAAQLWGRLLAQLKPDSPEARAVQGRLDQLR